MVWFHIDFWFWSRQLSGDKIGLGIRPSDLPTSPTRSVWLTFAVALTLTLCPISVDVPTGGPLLAQDAASAQPFQIRKLYVPEEFPASWPKGEWQPISSAKFQQLIELNQFDQASQATFPTQMARYGCQFAAGKLVAGTVQLQFEGQSQSPEWLDLGTTTLPLRPPSSQPQVDTPIWGTGEDGKLYFYRASNQNSLTANWSLTGVPDGLGEQFTVSLLPATQSTFEIEIPNTHRLTPVQPANMPIFRTAVSDDTQRWTIRSVEQNELVFKIEPNPTATAQQTLFSQQTHGLTISPSSQTFVSEFVVEPVTSTNSTVEILVPSGYQIDSVRTNKLLITSWMLEPVGDDRSGARKLTIPLKPIEGASQLQLQLRGVLTDFRNAQLSTGFPVLLGTLHLQTRVNLDVQSPFVVASLDPSGLRQTNAQWTTGVRDIWSYEVTDSDPTLNLTVATPDPELIIDQLTVASQQNDQLDVKLLMIWTTAQNRQFGARFQLAPRFEVEDVVAIRSPELNQAAPDISWSVLRQPKQRNELIIRLSNQLVPNQPLPIAVRLKKKKYTERNSTTALPVLTPLDARLGQNALVTNELNILKAIPSNATQPELTDQQMQTWAVFKSLIPTQSAYAWKSTWNAIDLSQITRVITRQQRQPDPVRSAISNRSSAEQIVLQTELIAQQNLVVPRFRLAIPSERFADQLSVQIGCDTGEPNLNWQEIIPDSNTTARADGLPAIKIQNRYSRQGGCTYSFSAPLGYSSDQPSRLFEAYGQPIAVDQFSLPLLGVKSSGRWTGVVHWNPDQLSTQVDPNDLEIEIDPPAGVAQYADYSGETLPVLNVTSLVDDTGDGDGSVKSGTQERWQYLVKADRSTEPTDRMQVQVDYQLPDTQFSLQRHHFEFPRSVLLTHVSINGQLIPVGRSLTNFTLPEFSQPVRSIRLDYQYSGSSSEVDRLLTPQPDFELQLPKIVLKVPDHLRPRGNTAIAFWQPVESSSDENSTNLRQAYAGFVATQLPTQIPLEWTTVSTQPYLIPTWLFLTVLLGGLFVATFGSVSARVWGLLSLIAIAGFLLSRSPTSLSWLSPVAAGLVLVTQLLSWWRTLKVLSGPDSDGPTPDRMSSLGLLFQTGTTAVICVVWLATTPSLAQVSPEDRLTNSEPAVVMRYDVLIPVPAEQMQSLISGNTDQRVPEVVYITPDLARQLNQQVSQRNQLNQRVYQSARYQAVWTDRQQLEVRCRYQILDPTAGRLGTRFVIPIKNIHALSVMRAVVNGEAVKITPLSDGSGLEIPLPAPTPTDSAEPIAKAELPSYEILIDVVPAQTQSPAGIQPELTIPPVIDAALELTCPQDVECQFALTDQRGPAVTDSMTAINNKIAIGKLSRLSFQFEPLDSTQPQAVQSDRVISSDLLGQDYPDYLELDWQVDVSFAPRSERTVQLQLPAGMLLRSLYSATPVVHQLARQDDQSSQLTLKFEAGTAASADSSASVMLNLVQPYSTLNRQDPAYSLTMPQIITPAAKKDSLSWQVAIATAPTRPLTKIEFPGAASSRISSASFVDSLLSKTSPLTDLAIFRVIHPQRVTARRDPLLQQQAVTADHVCQITPASVQNRSRYRVELTNQNLWELRFEPQTRWKIGSVTARVDDQPTSTRAYQQGRNLVIGFGAPATKTVDLEISWEKNSSGFKVNTNVTPTRIQTATNYQETIKLDSESNPNWALDASLEPQPNATMAIGPDRSLMFQAASADDLPELRLTKRPNSTPDRSTSQPDQANALQPEPATSARGNMRDDRQTAESQTDSPAPADPVFVAANDDQQGIWVDHSIWIDHQTWHGETLITWPSQTSNSLEMATTFTVPLPTELKITETKPFGPQQLKISPNRIDVISEPSALEATSDTAFNALSIKWQVDRANASPTILPAVALAERTHWRLFKSGVERRIPSTQRQEISDISYASWQQYLEQLQRLGVEVDPAEPKTTDPKQSDLPAVLHAVEPLRQADTDLSPNGFQFEQSRWPSECVSYFDDLPAQTRRQIERGWQRLSRSSWLEPQPSAFVDVASASRSRDEPFSMPAQPFAALFTVLTVLTALIWSGLLWWANRRAVTSSAHRSVRSPTVWLQAVCTGLLVALMFAGNQL